MKKASLTKTLLTACLAVTLCGCGATKAQSASGSMHVDDLWTVTDYIEKTTADLQLPESCICFMKEKPFMACVDGDLFGRKADGTLRLDEDFSIRSAHFYSGELKYEDALRQFTALYGEPVAKGEEPGVEIDGGAARWCRFNTGKYIVTLSAASGYDYIFVNIAAGFDSLRGVYIKSARI